MYEIPANSMYICFMKHALLTLLSLLLAGCTGDGGTPAPPAPETRILELSPQEFNLGPKADVITVAVEANITYGVETGVDWVRQEPGSPSEAPRFTVQENPTRELRGTKIKFYDPADPAFEKTVRVRQEANPDAVIEKGETVIVAYVTSWSSPVPDSRYMTHLNYAFGHVNGTFDGVRIDNEPRFRQMLALKEKDPGLKVLLSVGGWGSGGFSEMASTEARRKAFALSCKKMLDSYGADGIDIDWEYPGSGAAGISSSAADKGNYTALMKALREAIGEDKLLTLASSCDAGYIDFRAILPYVDFINIMAYDMASAPEHNAPLYRSRDGKKSAVAGWYTTDEAVKAHLNAGIPAGKLVLGMPFYGHGNGTYGSFVDYRDIKGPKAGDTEKWDEVGQVPYYANSAGTLTLGFDNPRSIQAKCRYILESGLLGGMYWEYSCDNAALDLTRAVAEALFP